MPLPAIPVLALPGLALAKKIGLYSLIAGGGGLGIGLATGGIQDSLTQGAQDKLKLAISQGEEDRLLGPNGAMKVNPIVQQFVDEQQLVDDTYNQLQRSALRSSPEFREAVDLLGEVVTKDQDLGRIAPGDFLAQNTAAITKARTSRDLETQLAGMVTVDGTPVIVPESAKGNPNALRSLIAKNDDAISRSPYGAKGQEDYRRQRLGVSDRNNTKMLEYQIATARDANELARFNAEASAFDAAERRRYENRILDWKSGEADADRKQQLGLYQLQAQNQRAERESRESIADRRERLQMMLALISRGTQGLQQIRF